MNTDSRVPPRDEVVLRYLLERRAAEDPERVFVVFDGGPVWTRGELLEQVRRTAAQLQSLGVGQNDHVVCWLPNGPEMMRFWFAINYLGAVFVPINTAYRGGVLSHVLDNADAEVLVGAAELIPRIDEAGSPERLRRVIQVGGTERCSLEGPDVVTVDEIAETQHVLVEPAEPVEPWHTQAIYYTSGTTGPSKGVLCSYMQSWAGFSPQAMPFLTRDDRFLINMPAFHVGGSTLVYAMLVNGGSVAVTARFSGENFWRQIRESDSTAVFLLGVMAQFVERRAPAPDDARNPLRTVFTSPLIDDVAGFAQRFGVDVYTIYNMTELSAPIVSGPNPTLRGTCGKVRAGVEVRLVDEADREVPIGDVGEIVVRTDAPWTVTHGYYRMPEATAKAWRNGWFHTGDSARRDAEGNFFFVDRLKDAIRRRGENISSMEVENEILAHPKVREAAVVAVPGEISEDEVLAIVSPVPGETIDPVELIRFLEPRMAHYMVPRYVRFLSELPKTPTAKIQKNVLREAALTEDTWDREKSGITISR
ncbi:crotonobetaine/carnitine-CoA ligase [Prauserella sediminis]|uniref:Crotonobetaine/carnitine-CoA ligase n=1 Tax=Prauserella sediminis TaxID=577680 RepID=A0A839XNV7_9PSEU|nr:AMP-binding protein [Prauserella sediminis]MBB3664431.1 crotonobetaine/carnitine-CoA ligase [Prauserella sediminis]